MALDSGSSSIGNEHWLGSLCCESYIIISVVMDLHPVQGKHYAPMLLVSFNLEHFGV